MTKKLIVITFGGLAFSLLMEKWGMWDRIVGML